MRFEKYVLSKDNINLVLSCYDYYCQFGLDSFKISTTKDHFINNLLYNDFNYAFLILLKVENRVCGYYIVKQRLNSSKILSYSFGVIEEYKLAIPDILTNMNLFVKSCVKEYNLIISEIIHEFELDLLDNNTVRELFDLFTIHSISNNLLIIK